MNEILENVVALITGSLVRDNTKQVREKVFCPLSDVPDHLT
jgi:hypothetical protein